MSLISDIILPETVNLFLQTPRSKDELFRNMVNLLHKANTIDSQDNFLDAIYERESLGPTYMGDFIAIPHGKSSSVIKTAIAICRFEPGFFYPTEDEEVGGIVKLVFMLAIPDQMSGNEYIRILSRLARLLVYPEFVERLFSADEYDEVISSVEKFEPLLDG